MDMIVDSGKKDSGEDSLDELDSGRLGPLRVLDCSVATLAEISEVSAEPATTAGPAKLEQRGLVPFGPLLPSSGFSDIRLKGGKA